MFIFEIIILAYLAFVVCHNLFFSLVSYAYSEKRYTRQEVSEYLPMLVLVPAYKEDGVIVSTAQSAASHNYPKDKFKVVIIADSLQPMTLAELANTGADVMPVHFEKSTKVKALKEALNKYEGYEIAVILDADNVMEEGFLRKINQAYQNGYTSIQGRRVAKNTNTQFAFLDGISESVNNRIFRRGYSAIGMPVCLIGSGMSFPFTTLKHHINEMDSVGGFDRELNIRLLGDNSPVSYLESAIVLDEKVEKPETFANQRRRWLSSQFVYLRKYFLKGCKKLVTGNLAFFDAAVIQNMLLPRVLMLGILSVVAFIYLALSPWHLTAIPFYWPLLLLVLYGTALLIAVPKKYFTMDLLRAVIKLPQAFVLMFLNLFKLRNANKQFIHTPHGPVHAKPKDEPIA